METARKLPSGADDSHRTTLTHYGSQETHRDSQETHHSERELQMKLGRRSPTEFQQRYPRPMLKQSMVKRP
ncbi:hypothetical protein TGAMA5MH_02790 [Trichoderma gamsii]|uniref:Uncharacterized protein n=1 Tax=Trichoderma gamsii TaxID=398673 RepID=A0A2K0TJA1_9HYPO|nr:hypothetical protein TGAMA5MH_02790 [Trichoderma gamsii]